MQPSRPIAIVGMSCRLPGGADTPAKLWGLLLDGVDAIREVPPDRFDLDEAFDPDPAAPGKIYTRWGGFIEGIAAFDADFFGISPREARRMDPQHRLLLETTWEALEDGGQVPARMGGTSTGVFVGISTHDYADLHVRPGRRDLLDAHVNIGNALCAAANRISYLLDLRGPSFAVESACSSSLTAVHLACQSLRSGESELAIVAGVNLVLAPELTVGFCKAGMISPDGRCRAFDARANGYVRAEGGGAVILKPLEQALEDRDPIRAVIRGTAINEDGRTTGISLPNGEAQEDLLRQALREAGLRASDIQYVEAHGTGTAAGDPVEARALGRVFGAGRAPGEECVIGSVKTNVGHLEAAAGIAGLVKTVLCLEHRTIPPSLHFEEPNPAIPFEELRLRVATTTEAWPGGSKPARAGVNAFGFGGSNAHVLLEEPPRVATRDGPTARGGPHILVLSARSPEALRAHAGRHAEHLRGEAARSLEDLCYTASTRRSHHEHRLAVVGGDRDELVERLEAFARGEERPDVAVGRSRGRGEPRVVFAFSGMGPQWWGMGRELLAEEPAYRDALTECDRLLRPISGWSLLDELGRGEADSRIGDADRAHVANCALQIALAALWRSWGVEPDVVVGHSSGEIAAACVSGALSLPDALYLAYHRGRLQHTLAGKGGMLAAALSPEEARSACAGLEERVSLAAVNSPESVTLSGELAALERIARDLERRERFCRRLRVDVPYHAPQMEAIRSETLRVLEVLEPRSGTVPFVSGQSGAILSGAELNRDYWWRNLREPVRFDLAADRLMDDACEVFLEVGPHPVLSAYLAECLAGRGETAAVLPTLRRAEPERARMLRSLAALYATGRSVRWSGVYPEGTCVPLPSYPWQRERHWLEAGPERSAASPGIDTGHPLLGRRLHSPLPAWEAHLDDPRTGYVSQHRVEGSIVFPGAGYIESMLAAATQLEEGERLALEDVSFEKLLVLETPADRVLHVHFQPTDSLFEIHSALRSDPGSWTRHATARLRRSDGGSPIPAVDLDAVRARCPESMPIAAHFRSLEPRGFRYGDAFRGLHEIRFGNGEAMARVGFLPGVELSTEPYRIHPALLDAAFQVLAVAGLRDLDADETPGPLFPVGIERVVFTAPPGSAFHAHVTVRRRGAELLEGDVFLTDDEGTVALGVEGLRMKRVGQVRTDTTRNEGWLYELRWEEARIGPPAGPPSPSVRASRDVRREVESRVPAPERDPEVARYHDLVAPTLDRVAARFAQQALTALGWDPDGQADVPAKRWAERLSIQRRHHHLFAELLRMAAGAGSADGTQANQNQPEALLDRLAREAPAYAAECELVRRGGVALADVLRGVLDTREILLSGESLELLGRMYHDSPPSRNYHAVLAEAVAVAVSRSADAAPPRILEIGAGLGAATAQILLRLPAGVEYVFTDISPYFPAQASERFGAVPGRRFGVLDIERDPMEQGFDAHGYDLVVAANVMHATADLGSSLAQVRKLLRPGGVVAILELDQRSDWFNLVFGLLDGWWRFTDFDLRPASPLLGSKQWASLLEGCGFRDPTNLFEGERADGALQTVILAHAAEAAAGSVASRTPPEEGAGAGPSRPARSHDPGDGRTDGGCGAWLLLADERGVAAGVAEALRARGDRCVLAFRGDAFRRDQGDVFTVPPASPEAMSRLVEESGVLAKGARGVAHLWSLDAPACDALSVGGLMESQRLGCLSLLDLLRGRDGASIPALWLVTCGAHAVRAGDGVPGLSQATLWGLGRVVPNEHENLPCRLVDLDPDPKADPVGPLVALLCSDEEDEEIALRGGTRFVRRLHRASPEARSGRQGKRRLSPRTASFRLEIGRPGALETLILRKTPPAEPGTGELALDVRASGLNFQEVLQALGMLPEAALPAGADPRALGVECAGVVLACGEGVDGFQPGDEIIALASGAHGSRAIAPAHLVVPKPPELSFAEAASVVNAFVTASYSLHHLAGIRAGERVLVHSASGGVGLAAIQLCQEVGAEVFASAGTPQKRKYLATLGVEHVMESRSLAFADDVMSRTGGEGVDVVLNSLAGRAMEASLELLRPYGRFIELGKREIHRNAALHLRPFRRNLSYSAVDLQQAAVDRPELANRLIREAVSAVADGRWSVLPTTGFDLAEAERAFRYMAQARHIGKIVLETARTEYPVAAREDAPLWRSDATYLITGGLGGFGLAVAESLVERGARSLVLLSRSGVPRDDGHILRRLRESGAHVTVVRGDVADERDVGRALDLVREELPPLAGVFHAAMVLDDGMLEDLDETKFLRVLAPKVAGAWNLHRMTMGDDLDHFVLFSSIASVIGHPMQGNYAAANAFLDALPSHRRALGLPALAIGWGALAGVGYVSRHPVVAEYLERSGFRGFTPAEAFEAMERLLRLDVDHAVPARIDWRQWSRTNPVMAASRRFLPLALAQPEPGTAEPSAAHSPLAALRAAPPEGRVEALERYLTGKVARVLDSVADRVDLERSLPEMGFDSLMAVELVTALNADLGVKLPVVKILQGVDIRGLGRVLLERLDLDSPQGVRGTAGAPAVPEASSDRGFPLSAEQRRFWFLERLTPGDPALHLFGAARLRGPLDGAALRRSVEAVVARHDVLRATFSDEDGEPRQRIAEPMRVPLPERDLRGLPPQAREAELQRILTAEIQRPFDLARPPLLRGLLVRMEEDEHAIVLVVHHVACDAWSMTAVVREVMASYAGFVRGRPAPLPKPSTSYGDYVTWQEEAFDSDLAEAQLTYWKERLAAAPARLDLPTDRPRKSAGMSRGARVPFELSPRLSSALRELGREEGVTLFVTLLAAFQTLLHRYSGQTDLTIGTPVATRDRGATGEEIVGCCMNTLALRTDASGDPTFRDMLQRARETTLGAFEHQDVPFERVVEALRPPREATRSPLFQAMLILHDQPWPDLRMGSLEVEPLEVQSGGAVSDLTLLVDGGERIRGCLEYDSDLFEEATAARMLRHLRTLLEEIVGDRDRQLSALPLWEKSESLRMESEWNDTAVPLPGSACLHQLVEAQVARTPDAVAVVFEGERLTYRELDQRSGRLAARLRRSGVGPEVVVAVCMERSSEMVVAGVGILKAGGAYLPVDPSHPAERLRVMLADAGVQVIVTQQRLAGQLPEHGAEVLVVDAAPPEAGADRWQARRPTAGAAAGHPRDGEPAREAGSGVQPDNLAYVIFTSGSTGRPKAVAVEHRAIRNQVLWRQRLAPLTDADAVLMRTPVDFDPAIWELFGPLSAGARLILPGPGVENDPAELVRLISRERVSTLQVVPGVLEALVEEPGFEACSTLRRLFCGGEPLPPHLAETVLARDGTELHHLYGPAEATIDAASWKCRPRERRVRLPIGRPIANVRIHVLDPHGRPAPIGVPGELVIGGAGLARGYLNNPELTAERFSAHPLPDAPDARIFRTGDRARRLPDGSLELLGRLDDQVKIRGFRVEPNEVEAALARHPAVRQAAVVPREDPSGNRRLVAYLVPGSGTALSDHELERFLASHLPGYMVPAEWVVIEALPRLPSGKVDRRALTSREPAFPGSEREHVPARDAVELQLVQIWEQLLGVRPIGVTEDFFDLGGHSLLAMRLTARIHRVLGREIPVSALVRDRTIARLAQVLREPEDGSPSTLGATRRPTAGAAGA